MILVPLQSGSTGNSIYVRTSSAAFLFDAGIRASTAAKRLASCGEDLMLVDALFISHEHSDHIKFAKVYAQKHEIPIYITEKTFLRSKRRFGLENLSNIRIFRAGDQVEVKGVLIHTIPTPHDAVDGSAFVVQDQNLRVGVFTDLGHVFPMLETAVTQLDGIYIESNYDPAMLRNGKYPAVLKRRIAGPGGHISNADVAKLLSKFAGPKLQWVCLGHLSEENNTAELALKAVQAKVGLDLPIGIASRYEAGPMFVTCNSLFNPNPIRCLQRKAESPETFGYQLELFPQDLLSLQD